MNQDEAMSYTTIVVTGGVGPNPVGIGSDFTGGSSGGGWMIGWSPTSPGYINGHNDFTNSGVANTMFSPYLDSVSNTVRCFGRTTC
jgi:hypothetical protein